MLVRRPAAALLVAALAACGGGEPPEETGIPVGSSERARIEVADSFATPESVLHDTVADVYLVSNINGSPTDKDDNGFISRVSPDGTLMQLKWIDAAGEQVVLHAPKGMAIRGDTLFVADIDCVKRFVRNTGAAAGEICFEGATFLNDVAVDANGVLYVTDSGLTPTFESSGTDAIWRFDSTGRQERLAQGPDLGRPNGIAFGPPGGYVVTFGSGEIYQIGEGGTRRSILPGAPDRALDGIVFTRDGGFLFSSWGDAAVHRVGPDGRTARTLENVESPADIGYDAGRDRVLVPLFNANRVVIQELGPMPEAPAPASDSAPAGG